MSSFSQCLYEMVSAGLADMQQARTTGKLPANPVSEAHFVSAWVTRALKEKRFDRRLVPILQQWQQCARSQGQHARLKAQFEQLSGLYAASLDSKWRPRAITGGQVTALCKALAKAGWQLRLDEIISGPCRYPGDGRPSLVICKQAHQAALSASDILQYPLSLYVRGDHQGLIDAAHNQGLLLFNASDYQSMVKYHGEYQLFPGNDGPRLPALPSTV